MENVYHNNLTLLYKAPFGAIQEGSKITLRLKLNDTNVKEVFIRLWDNKEKLIKMNKGIFNLYESTFSTDKTGIIWYYFIIRTNDNEYYYACKNDNNGKGFITNDPQNNSWQITVYSKDLNVPKWFKNSIVYQIFPDRYINSNNNSNELLNNMDKYGGTLKGLINKLDYLKNLGINAIYLNPIFEANSYHRYDTTNYLKIDNVLGTNNDYINLFEKAQKLNIKIILDGVFNHCGNNHLIFKDAISNNNSKYINCFMFYEYPKEYDCWWGYKSLPTWNKDNSIVTNFIFNNIIKKWDNYTNGWRIDASDKLDNKFTKDLCKSIKSNNIIIGEIWTDATNTYEDNIYKEYALGETYHSFMNYPLRQHLIDFISNKINAKEFNNKIMSLYSNYPKDIFYSLLNMLSSHDVARLLTLFEKIDNNKDNATKRLKLAYSFIFNFIGVPCIYYGDEIGMEGENDPYNRKPMEWYKVENNNILLFFKNIVKLRSDNETLICGDFKPVYYHDNIYIFERKYNKKSILYIMNIGEQSKIVHLKRYGNIYINGLDYGILQN